MIGYGLAKAAVHQLTKSLAEEKSGLPKDSLVVSILPITLDTPMNRKWMPQADRSSWTPLEFVAEYVTIAAIIIEIVFHKCRFHICFFFAELLPNGQMGMKDLQTDHWFVWLPKTILPI